MVFFVPHLTPLCSSISMVIPLWFCFNDIIFYC